MTQIQDQEMVALVSALLSQDGLAVDNLQFVHQFAEME